MSPTARLTANVPNDVADAIKARAAREEVSVQQVVRRMILQSYRMQQAGSWPSTSVPVASFAAPTAPQAETEPTPASPGPVAASGHPQAAEVRALAAKKFAAYDVGGESEGARLRNYRDQLKIAKSKVLGDPEADLSDGPDEAHLPAYVDEDEEL